MLDKRDRLILYELDKNARLPLSKIAKKARLSREAVLYRTRKYISEGIVRKYLTVVNLAKIGYTHHKIYLTLHNISEEEEKKLIIDLSIIPYIAWISSCDGKYSFIFTILAKNLIDLNEKIKEINKICWKYTLQTDITSIIKAYHYYRDYLIQETGTTERKIFRGGKKENITLDHADKVILDFLAKDSRSAAVDIANQLGTSGDFVLKRIKRLERANIIQHYMVWPSVNKLVGAYYKVLIKLNNIDEKNESRLYSFCQNNPYIVYIVHCLGPWQFEMDVEVVNIEEFRKLMRNFLNQFSESISQYTTLNIYDEHKFQFFDKRML